MSVTRNTWPCFFWFSLIRAQNWEPFLLFASSFIRNFLTKFEIFYKPDGPVANRFNWFSTIVGWLCQSWGIPDFALFSSHSSGLGIEHPLFFLIPYSFRNFLTKFKIFYQPDGQVGNRFNRFSTIVGWLCQSRGTPDLALFGSHKYGIGIENRFFFLFLIHLETFWPNLGFFINQMDELETGSTGSVP